MEQLRLSGIPDLPIGQKWKAEWLLPECQPLVPENQGMTRYGHAGGAVAIELSYFAKVSSDYVTTTSVSGYTCSSDVALAPFDRPLAAT